MFTIFCLVWYQLKTGDKNLMLQLTVLYTFDCLLLYLKRFSTTFLPIIPWEYSRASQWNVPIIQNRYLTAIHVISVKHLYIKGSYTMQQQLAALLGSNKPSSCCNLPWAPNSNLCFCWTGMMCIAVLCAGKKHAWSSRGMLLLLFDRLYSPTPTYQLSLRFLFITIKYSLMCVCHKLVTK